MQTGYTRNHRIGFMPRVFQTFQTQLGGYNGAGGAGGFFICPVQDLNSPWASTAALNNNANNPGGVITLGTTNTPYTGYNAAANIYGSYRAISYCFELTVIPALAGDAVQVIMLPYNTTNQVNISTITTIALIGSQGASTGMAVFGGEPLVIKRWYSAAAVAGMTKAQWEAQPSYPMAGTPTAPYAVVQFIRWQTIDGAPLSGQLYWNMKVSARFELTTPNVQSN